MINPENEKLYNVRTALPDHLLDFKRWADSSAACRQQLKEQSQLDLAYGSNPRQRLDLFLAPTKAPLHVFLHGGYWQALEKEFFSYLAPAFLGAGTSLAIVNYRLCPDVTIKDIASDISSALVWLSRHGSDYGYEGEGLHLSGHSAGGHLVAMMMSDPDIAPLIGSAVSISGLFDLHPLIETSMNEKLRLDQQSALQNSPAFKPSMADVPLILAVGEFESQAFHGQSKLLAKNWQPHCNHIHQMELAQCNHLTAIDQLANSESELFRSVINQTKSRC